MSRSQRWSRCAIALLLTLTACSTAWPQSGNPMGRPYRASQMTPMRQTQGPLRRVAQMSPSAEPSVIYDGDVSGPIPSELPPAPSGEYEGNYNGGISAGPPSGPYNSGGSYNGSYNGSCNGGCNGSCGCGGNGGCYGGCGDGCCGNGYSGGYCGDSCGYGDGGYGCGDGCYDDIYCGIACNQPRLSAYVDWLALSVSDADIAHAQQQNGIGGSGTVPFGHVGSLEIENDNGVRVGGSIGCGPCSGFLFSFTNFESFAQNRVDPPFLPGGDGAVGSLVHHPEAQILASVGPVRGFYDVDFRMADFLCRRYLTGDGCYAVNYQFGAQAGHLEQFFLQRGIFSGGQGGAIDTFTNIDFDGAGVKIGLDAERFICWGFHAYGRLTAAAMTGRFQSRYDMVNTSTEVQLARVRWKDNRVVPQIEYEVGMGWTSPSGHWRFATGYLLSHWMNTVTTPVFIDAVQADNYTDIDGDLTFQGGVTRLELRW